MFKNYVQSLDRSEISPSEYFVDVSFFENSKQDLYEINFSSLVLLKVKELKTWNSYHNPTKSYTASKFLGK